ncbi:DNA primase [Nanchangia anserum]|uniref:DNA primase n=1 Tax=Nanchangia anserum TaxID=2692125 RepID=A0A8I0GAP9_9ACTO|nr:DNA primase [Nanchangia anserum]MBD3688675.1 DNA primase [Nanchangia anserum]QOX82428.1 DNA primase [Nanchangia anserum]
MAKDPRAALDHLIAVLEKHYAAATTSKDPDADDVVDSETALQDAFFAYDQALFKAVGVELPFDIVDDEDDEDDDGVFDDDDYEFGDDEDDDY